MHILQYQSNFFLLYIRCVCRFYSYTFLPIQSLVRRVGFLIFQRPYSSYQALYHDESSIWSASIGCLRSFVQVIKGWFLTRNVYHIGLVNFKVMVPSIPSPCSCIHPLLRIQIHMEYLSHKQLDHCEGYGTIYISR